jgi:hypothetical protein
MNTATLLGFLVLLTHISGCDAGTASEVYQYTKAKPRHIENKVVIDKPLEQVWSDMVKHMSNTHYHIHSSKQASRNINFDFQAGTAAEVEKYIDCGSSTRVITYQDKTHKFKYALAGSQSYETVSKDKDNFLYNVSPHMSLSGTVAITLLALNDRQTEIRVNARYAMTRVLSVKSYTKDDNGNYQVIGDFGWHPIYVRLTTKQPGSYAENPAVQCMATGALETEVLKYARNTKYASN